MFYCLLFLIKDTLLIKIFLKKHGTPLMASAVTSIIFHTYSLVFLSINDQGENLFIHYFLKFNHEH